MWVGYADLFTVVNLVVPVTGLLGWYSAKVFDDELLELGNLWTHEILHTPCISNRQDFIRWATMYTSNRMPPIWGFNARTEEPRIMVIQTTEVIDGCYPQTRCNCLSQHAFTQCGRRLQVAVVTARAVRHQAQAVDVKVDRCVAELRVRGVFPVQVAGWSDCCWRAPFCKISLAAFSAIMKVAALVLAEVMDGITEASMTRSFVTPRTRS